MRALSPRAIRLSERMRQIGDDVIRSVPEPDLTRLRGEIRQLKRMLGSSGAGSGTTPDRLREQLTLFRETGKLSDVRAARLVCWGTTLRDRQSPPLIEEETRFPDLIDQVDGYRENRRPYRRCWRGLLDGYVRYDPGSARDAGRKNWLLLREYLNDNLPSLERVGRHPDWLETIDEHANLLGERPCDRYGASLLEGDSEVLEPLRRDLGVGDSSWLMRQIVDAQITAAVGYDDRRLRQVMPKVVELISDLELLADEALARVLDRYAKCASIEVDAELRDLAVGRWGNPWLERNDTQWTTVGSDARQMVASWLKLSLIEKFFSLLSEDRLNDERRVAFWKKYVDRIDDMHFALGETAYTSSTADFRALRKAMAGRLLRLDNAGTAKNNAFIMRMRDRVFVEFGEKGNAMFAFDAGHAPFDLRRTSISGGKAALKHPSHLARMIHTDSGGARWEQKIERRIDGLLALRPTPTPPQAQPRSLPPAPSLAAPVPAPPMPAPGWVMPSPSLQEQGAGDLFALFAEHRIKSVDLRDKGGSLWAYAPVRGPATASLLRRGFVWSDRRGAWYLKS